MNYLLEKDEWFKMSQELTYTEIKVYFYLKMEKISEINVSDIAETLGINKRTVNRSLNVLNDKGFITVTKPKSIYRICHKKIKNEQREEK